MDLTHGNFGVQGWLSPSCLPAPMSDAEARSRILGRPSYQRPTQLCTRPAAVYRCASLPSPPRSLSTVRSVLLGRPAGQSPTQAAGAMLSGLRPASPGRPGPALAPTAAPPRSLLQSLRGRLLARVQPTLTGPLLPLEAVATIRQRGLERAEAVLSHSLKGPTLAKQHAAGRELATWLVGYGGGASLSTCSPDDVLVYLMEWWLPNHRGRRTKGGPPTAAAVLSHLSLLSGLFWRLGRGEAYDPTTGMGNPCAAPEVSDFRRAYPRLLADSGVLPLSAKPLSEEKYRALVGYLWGRIFLAAGILDRILLLRDLLCAQYMWLTSMRGHDTGKLRLTDFVSPTDLRNPYTGFPLPAVRGNQPYSPDKLVVAELGTKTYQGTRAPPICIHLGPKLRFCFVRTLALYQGICGLPNAPPGAVLTGFLFKPLRSDRRGFEERPFSSSSLGSRLRLHLTLAGLYEGESCHSFRRGTLQHAAAQGASRPTLQEFAQLRSAAVLERYLDTERHLETRPTKKRKA